MPKENPLHLRPKKGKGKGKSKIKEPRKICIIHYQSNKEDNKVNNLTDYSFSKIKEAADIRQEQSDPNIRLDDIVEIIPNSFDVSLHGAHRWCYQNFTNISRLKQKRSHPESQDDDDSKPSTSSKRMRRSSSASSVSSVLFPSDKCLFCEKETIKVKGVKQKLVKCLTKTAEKSIKAAAEKHNDEELLRVVRDADLIAREAHYHSSCRKNYTRKAERNPSFPESEASHDLNAHKKAFDCICNYIEVNIVNYQKVERMTMIRERYLNFLLENSPEVYNADYKTYKLKNKLVKYFGSRIKFWQPSSYSELVYSDEVSTGQAIGLAFEIAASDERRLEESALIIRRHIKEAQTTSETMPWPPSTSWLLSQEQQIPSMLLHFLSHAIAAGPYKDVSTRVSRRVKAVAQDICYSATHGEWAMPKHILLAMTIRHLTGSAELITLLNRLGHCQSYTQTVELETAKYNSITSISSVLPPTISTVRNSVVHLCWDNFDLNEETPSGAGTTHTTHGIIIQEKLEPEETVQHQPEVPKSRERSARPKFAELKPCFVKQKAEPKLEVVNFAPRKPVQEYIDASFSNFLWIYCRGQSSDKQTIPSWAGWLSVTAGTEREHMVSTVDYMAPINFSVNDNATVQHVLEISQTAATNVGQNYAIVTFDLAVAKKAYSIVWQKEEFHNVIVRMGVFHTICSLFGALGKKMAGSGLSEILIEAGVCASGSMDKVMSGKHYNRALRVHKVTVEALERLLLKVFVSQENIEIVEEETLTALANLCNEPDAENFQKVCESEYFKELFRKYGMFKQSVRNGSLGMTAQYWLSYIDTVWLILTLIRATKENNLDLHISCLYELCPLFFQYDRTNYARYIPVYFIILMNLATSHPGAEDLLRRNGFSVSRSDVPFSRNAVDITIEQTINRHAKSQGGIIGFSRNYEAYHRWCVTRHYRAQIVEATMGMAEMLSAEDSVHKDLRPSQIKSSEASVQRMIDAFGSFINPFEVENKTALYCLSSGIPASTDVAKDLLKADELGEQAMKDFIQDRLIDRSVSFHSPIKKMKLKTFASAAAVKKIKSSDNKLVEVKAERNIFGQLILLSMQYDIDLRNTLSYPLGPVPWSLATPDGSPVKTDKAKLLHLLESTVEPAVKPADKDMVYICDGNAFLQSLTNLPDTFEGVAERVFSLLPNTSRVDFVTDTYQPSSIKTFERRRRGTAPTFLLSGPKTKTPRDWKAFMSNADNKTQLIKLLLQEWKTEKYASRLHERQLFYVCGEDCYLLTSDDGSTVKAVKETVLCSSQEEADTRIILHCMHIGSNFPPTCNITVRSPDTDVLVLLVKYSQQLQQVTLFDTGVGNKRRLLNVKDIVSAKGSELCSSLPSLHAFSGCDTVSAFVRRGKLTPLRTLEKNPEYLSAFGTLGQSFDLDEDILQQLEKFTCIMYGKSNYSDINSLRYDMFVQKYRGKSGQLLTSYEGVDLSLTLSGFLENAHPQG